MKALVLEKYKDLKYQEVPEPEVGENDVLIKVQACGICGSDIHGWDGSTGRRIPPLIMGHEASGEIAAVGSQVKGWKAGDRVTFDSTVYPLNDWYTLQGHYNLSDNRQVLGVSPGEYRRHGAFAEYLSVPAHILYKIPDNVTYEQAAMVEPIAVAMHGIQVSSMRIGDHCAVVGVGMVGAFLLQLLKLAGARTLTAIDINEDNLAWAKELGADHIIHAEDSGLVDQVLKYTEGRGVDQVFEVVGITSAVNTAVDVVRKGGHITLVGNLAPKIEFPLQKVVTREITLQGSCSINGEYPAVLSLLSQGKIKMNESTSKVAPLSEGAEWFDRLYKQEKGLGKVILKP